jgi:hypothetical protein
MYRYVMSRVCVVLVALSVGPPTVFAEDLPIPPQDQGLAYTRSGPAMARARIAEAVAVLPGSRVAWVKDRKVRLDPKRLRSGEAVAVDGEVWVPEAFAAAVLHPDAKADTAPSYLADRYVYTLELPEVDLSGLPRREVEGHRYIPLLQLARQAGLTVTRGDHGLVLLGDSAVDYASWSQTARDAVTVLFDTPEKYAVPEIAYGIVPMLVRQGSWTNIAPVTEEELALLEGPEPNWPVVARESYDNTGLNMGMLGSPVPPPGVYPRLLFSPEDLPAIRQRISENVIAQKTLVELDVLFRKSWMNPESNEGRLLERLVAGDTEGMEWDPWKDGRRLPGFPEIIQGYERTMASSHVSYNSQSLVSMALYALVTDDAELGRKAATALVNLYRMHEPHLDTYLAMSDSELGTNPSDANGATTQWRGVSVAGMDLAFALDFGGAFMTPEQKADMVRIIAKATYGRRTNGGDGPRRNWRDNNHVTWHMTHYLALAAIEGLEGFDPAAYESGEELVEDFLQWGVNEYGTMYESNGKSGGGLQFQILCMNAMARRGNNTWGHPHWRNLAKSQALNTAPNGETTVSSGTWSTGPLSLPAVMMFHSFYPEDRYAEFLLSCDAGPSATTTTMDGKDIRTFDLNAYRAQLEKHSSRTRIPGINTPGFTMTLIYDTDWQHTRRSDLNAPLDFADTNQGILSSYSANSREAVWMHMQVRNNHYLGAGHHHADAGMFHFASDGVNWITESPFLKWYDGRFHNQVLVDGRAQPDDINGRADLLGMQTGPELATATADLTQAYSVVWKNQFIFYDTADWGPRPDAFDWSLSHDPLALNAFKGTQRYKMRPWWPTHNFARWTPVLQRLYNPMEYVFRSTTLIRGAHPYGLVVDDLKKDDEIRLYQWCAMAGPGVWAAEGYTDLPRNMVVLTRQGKDRHHAGGNRFRPREGDPMLLVCILGGRGVPDGFTPAQPHLKHEPDYDAPVEVPVRIETAGDGPDWQGHRKVQTFYDRIIGGCQAREAHFKTLLIPFRHGEELPEIQYDPEQALAVVQWPDQRDRIIFHAEEGSPTGFTVTRNGEALGSLDRDQVNLTRQE